MVSTRVLTIVSKAAPAIAKQLPKLLPLLLDESNRQRLFEAGRNVASKSPTRRLRGRVEVTATLAEGIATDARTDEERVTAEDWVRKSHNLARRLDMPVAGRNEKAAHRASISDQLQTLQNEMNDHLGK
jgi:hypothetical protein